MVLPDHFRLCRNDTFPNYLLHNNGDGTFTDVAMVSGVAYTDNRQSGRRYGRFDYPRAWITTPAKPDIFHTAMFWQHISAIQQIWAEASLRTPHPPPGLNAFTSRLTGWGTARFDFDNDGYKDLFTANSAILDNSMEVQHQPFALPNSLFHNKGGLSFRRSERSGRGRFCGSSRTPPGAAFGDLNNDGKVDVVVTVLNGAPQILMNRSPKQEPLDHPAANRRRSPIRDGLGTRVRDLPTAHGRSVIEFCHHSGWL